MRNVSHARKYMSQGLVLGNCSLRSSLKNVSHPRRYTSLNLVVFATPITFLLGTFSLVLRSSMKNVSRARRIRAWILWSSPLLSLLCWKAAVLFFGPQ